MWIVVFALVVIAGLIGLSLCKAASRGREAEERSSYARMNMEQCTSFTTTPEGGGVVWDLAKVRGARGVMFPLGQEPRRRREQARRRALRRKDKGRRWVPGSDKGGRPKLKVL